MGIVQIFVLAATFALAFVAAIWSTNGWPNIFVKLVFIALTVIGAICSAAILGLTPHE